MRTFQSIMKKEAKFNPACKRYETYGSHCYSIYLTTQQLFEVARSSLVLRSYVNRYHLSNDIMAQESVGAHTNLVSMLVDRAATHDKEFSKKLEYSYREMMEVVRAHDLPENETGDEPDNGSYNKELKIKLEKNFFDNKYAVNYPAEQHSFGLRVRKLYGEMNDQSSYAGRLLFSGDKTAAIIITLTYDYLSKKEGILPLPLMYKTDPYASERDKIEMDICDFVTIGGGRKASEMWTVDHLRLRQLIHFDDSGYFTAIIVMYTLIFNGCWYRWREEDYQT